MAEYGEPTWGTPENADTNINPLSDHGSLFLDIAGAFLQLTRYIWSSSAFIYSPYLSGYVWTSNRKTTPLVIEMTSGQQPRTDVPRILIKPEPVKLLDLQDLNRTGISVQGAGFGNNGHFNYITSGIRLLFKTDTAGLAWALAEDTFRWLLFMAPWIEEDFSLASLSVKGVQEPAKEEQTEDVKASVVLSWIKFKAWTVQKEAIY